MTTVLDTCRDGLQREKFVFTPWSQAEYAACDIMSVSNPMQDPDVGLYIAPAPEEEYLPSWYEVHGSSLATPEDKDAASKSLVHANAPHIDYFDALNRRIVGIDDNGAEGKNATKYYYDILGN